jgi:hypothetical protein
MSGRLIPFYSYDGSYIDHIAIRRAERLEEMGRVKDVVWAVPPDATDSDSFASQPHYR